MKGRSIKDPYQHRILLAAEELFLLYGYDKTTMEDIAKSAHVSKSTLYSRWNSKDALFFSLLWARMQQYIFAWHQRIEIAEDGGTLHGMFRLAMQELSVSPFMLAVFTRQEALLGNLMQYPDMQKMLSQQLMMRSEMIVMLQEAGVIRKDLDAEQFGFVMSCLRYGYLKISDIITADYQVPDFDGTMRMIVDMVEMYTLPPDGGNPQAGKEMILKMTDQFISYFENGNSTL